MDAFVPDFDLDVDRQRLAKIDAVVIHVIRKPIHAIRHGPDTSAHLSLAVIQQRFHTREHYIGPIYFDDIDDALSTFQVGRDLCSQIAGPFKCGAAVQQDDVQDILAKLPLRHETDGWKAETFSKYVRCAARGTARCISADIGMMGDVRHIGNDLPLMENGHGKRY